MNFPLNWRESALDPHGLRARSVLSSGPEEELIDLRATLLAVWQRKWLVLLTALAGAALAFAAAGLINERYTASARVLFEPERVRIIDLDSVIVSPDQTTIGLQNQVEILRSAILLDRVADILRLNKSPEFNPALVASPPTLLERAVARLGLPAADRRSPREVWDHSRCRARRSDPGRTIGAASRAHARGTRRTFEDAAAAELACDRDFVLVA